MPPSLLIAYASRNGSTREVAEAVKRVFDAHSEQPAAVRPVLEAKDLSGYTGVVLGGSIYRAALQQEAMLFLRRHHETLQQLPLAVFALGPIKRDPEEWIRSRRQLDASLAQLPGLRTRAIAVFGGVILPHRLPYPMSQLPPSDNRDWSVIKAWAREAHTALTRTT
jgi:menaquinone-dependent protoporphyrinogen oxidase